MRPARLSVEPLPGEVELLAEVITDAQRSGVRFGPVSLARHLLRAGFRQVADVLPRRGVVAWGRRERYQRRVVVVVDEPGRRQVLELTGLSDKVGSEFVSSAVARTMRVLYPSCRVVSRVIPADVNVSVVLDAVDPVLGPPRPSAATVRKWWGPDATIGRPPEGEEGGRAVAVAGTV